MVNGAYTIPRQKMNYPPNKKQDPVDTLTCTCVFMFAFLFLLFAGMCVRVRIRTFT